MSAIASQITSLTIVYSIVYLDADQSKHQSSASLAFVWGIHRGPGTGEFLAQMASNAENVSIWWRHHEHIPSGIYWTLCGQLQQAVEQVVEMQVICDAMMLMIRRWNKMWSNAIDIFISIDHCDQLIKRGRDKMATFLERMFSNLFSWKKVVVFCAKFYWNLFTGVQSSISQHCLR